MPDTDQLPTGSTPAPARRPGRRRWLVATLVVLALAVGGLVVADRIMRASARADADKPCAPEDSAVVSVDDYSVTDDDPINIARLYDVEVTGTVTNQGPATIVVATIEVPMVGAPTQIAYTGAESIELGPGESAPFVATGYLSPPSDDAPLEPDPSGAAVLWEPFDYEAGRC